MRNETLTQDEYTLEFGLWLDGDQRGQYVRSAFILAAVNLGAEWPMMDDDVAAAERAENGDEPEEADTVLIDAGVTAATEAVNDLQPIDRQVVWSDGSVYVERTY